jgi:hypothetical protein
MAELEALLMRLPEMAPLFPIAYSLSLELNDFAGRYVALIDIFSSYSFSQKYQPSQTSNLMRWSRGVSELSQSELRNLDVDGEAISMADSDVGAPPVVSGEDSINSGTTTI